MTSSIATRLLFVAASLAAAQIVPIPADRFPPDENPQYFPSGTFGDANSNGEISARWYAKHLRAMNEPVLSTLPAGSGVEVYRFLWLRTFHHPVAVRIEIHEDGKADAVATMTDGQGGYAVGKILSQSSLVIGAAQVERIHDLIRAMDFWSSPTELPRAGHNFDGSEWILEGATKEKYHVVDRWTPKDGALRDLGLFLVRDVAKFDISRNEIY